VLSLNVLTKRLTIKKIAHSITPHKYNALSKLTASSKCKLAREIFLVLAKTNKNSMQDTAIALEALLVGNLTTPRRVRFQVSKWKDSRMEIYGEHLLSYGPYIFVHEEIKSR
jgi:hypothetical protein